MADAGLRPPSCPLPIALGRHAPEGDVVQAHASQHDQKAVPQHSPVVFVLLLPGLWPLRPHVMKLGPVLFIGGCPRTAWRKKKGQCKDEPIHTGLLAPAPQPCLTPPLPSSPFSRPFPGPMSWGLDYCTCVPGEQTWGGLWFLETLGKLPSGAGGHSCGGSAHGSALGMLHSAPQSDCAGLGSQGPGQGAAGVEQDSPHLPFHAPSRDPS